MKKKIIYFCAGVLLSSLILIAFQVIATAPNPGHDITQISGDLESLTTGGMNLASMQYKQWGAGTYNGATILRKEDYTISCNTFCQNNWGVNAARAFYDNLNNTGQCPSGDCPCNASGTWLTDITKDCCACIGISDAKNYVPIYKNY